jgi:hypothetical protein
MVRKIRFGGVLALAAAAAAWTVIGCSTPEIGSETVASVNGEDVKVRELREFLGVRGGAVSAEEIPTVTKREALDRLIAGRLLSQEARIKGLDNTSEFKNLVKENDVSVLLAALFRKEVASKIRISKGDVSEQAKKLREADKALSEDNASIRARRMVSDAQIRKIEEELVAAARKEFPPKISQETIDKIAKGGKLADDAVLAAVVDDRVTYADVKRTLQRMSAAGGHGNQDLATNPVAVGRIVDREVTARSLAALAGKHGIANSEWMKSARQDMERSILIDMLAEKEILKDIAVSEKEIGDAYAEHGQMFVRDGRKIPLAQVKEQIRGFLANEKRKRGIEAYVGGLKGKAKITVNEGILTKV